MGTSAIRFWAGALAALWLAGSVASCGQPARAPIPPAPAPPLIARADLFSEPVRFSARLAPRGDRIAFLAPRDGVTNLWLFSVGAMDDARALTNDRARGVQSFVWAPDSATLLYLVDEQGDGATRLYAVDATDPNATPRALTPAGATAQILGVSPNDPGNVVVTLNQRDANWPDVYKIEIATGARILMQRNGNTASVRGFSRFVLDHDNNLRLGVKSLADGSQQVFARGAGRTWTSLFTIPFEDARSSQPLAFASDGRSFLMLDSTGRDRAALVQVDAATGVKTVLGESARADVSDVWLDPTTNAPEAFGADYLRREWRALDPDAQADLDFLDRQLTGEFSVVSRSADDNRWIVVEEGPATAARSYLYDRSDRANRRLTMLFRHRPNLEQAPLQAMTPVEIEARDGLTLVSYLTLPIGSDPNNDARPTAPVPLVIVPHDGPWARDSYGFNALHQWLANRGYAVLSVNFRGSTGLGKAFLNAGNREWGGKVESDLIDAVQWAVSNGIAQPDHIAILGMGFGGYAALNSLASAPQQFRCGAAFGGPANLAAMIDGAAAQRRDELYLRVGDSRTPEGRQLLREQSPLPRIGQIVRPVLLAMGAHDASTSRAEFDYIAQTLRGRRANLTYVVFPDDGRELSTANRMAFDAVLENFLSGCLGGRAEPVGTAFQGANMQVFDGASRVPGLAAFARRPPAPPVPTIEEDPNAAAEGEGGPEDAPPAPADATTTETMAPLAAPLPVAPTPAP